jgi:putative ATPase
MTAPLAERMRPRILHDVVGQEHLLGPSGVITRIIQSGTPLSILLWGPPGCGKTSIAKLYAKAFNASFYSISPIFNGIADLKKIIQEIKATPLLSSKAVLFVDEIHRFNKAQQDAFLPYIEQGTITLVGATAENPSFYLNKALLSRLQVFTLQPLNENALELLIQRFEKTFGPISVTSEARTEIVRLSQGDGRYLFNLLESLQTAPSDSPLDIEAIHQLLQRRSSLFDRAGDEHYNLISALHKSVRGSDPDASLYWFTRMLDGGEEPLFLARRLIRMASEDIGLADPHALPLAIAAKDAYEMLGSPEGELALAQVVIYLALAPKSNALYTAYNKSRKLASETNHLSPPKIILNAPTQTMKEAGYGKGYLYDHDQADAFSGQNYFPENLERQKLYQPVNRGFEREMVKRMEYFERLRKERSS